MDVYQPVGPHRVVPKSREAIGQAAFAPPVLGWYPPAVNSFAPLGNLITTSTEEPRTRQTPLLAVQVAKVLEAEVEVLPDLFWRSPVLAGRRQILSLPEIVGEIEPPPIRPIREFVAAPQPVLTLHRPRIETASDVNTAWALEAGAMPDVIQRSLDWIGPWQICVAETLLAGAQPRALTLPRPRIEIASDAEAFARRAGASGDLVVIGDLCLRVLPETKAVFIAVTHDPEEGTSGLHFRVRTSASVDAVVAAEDRLHEALFERIHSASRSLFSIGYEFVR